MNAEQEVLRIGKQLEKIVGSDTPVRSHVEENSVHYLEYILFSE